MLMNYLATLNEPFMFERTGNGLYAFTQNKKTVTAKTMEELYRKIKPLRYEDLTMYQLSCLTARLNVVGTSMPIGDLPHVWNAVRDGTEGCVHYPKKIQECIQDFQDELLGN